MKAKQYKDIVKKWAEDCAKGKLVVGKEVEQAANRYLKDLKRKDIELRPSEPDLAINLIQNTLVHKQGEDLEGNPLMGKPFLLEPWQMFSIYNLLGFYYKGTNERRFKEAWIEVGRKNGKALDLDTPIPTPEGFKPMAEITVGDFVFGEDGKPAMVVAESEIFHKPMYRVTFEDGAVIDASADHLWKVQTKHSRRTARAKVKRFHDHKNTRNDLRESGGWFVTTTEEMAKDFVLVRADGKGSEYRYRVPMQKAVQYSYKELPLDAYTFGVWLGDGASSGTSITCSDGDSEEMMKNLADCGHRVYWRTHKDRAGTIALDTVRPGAKHPIREALRELGAWENKHIPEIYMQASVEQRWALLQGLMDTDGTCEKAGQCVFTQKNKGLAFQVKELLGSLGIKASIRTKHVKCNGKDCGLAYYVSFFTDKENPCFRLKRKAARLKSELHPRMAAKSIVNIEAIDSKPSKCIAVDNESHLYLAGKDYTATHNTSFIAGLAWAVSIMQRHAGSKTYIVANALKQTLEAFHFLTFSLQYQKIADTFEIHDNSFDHSIKYTFKMPDGTPDGSMEIIAMPTNPESQDSFNCNFAIADEVAAYRKPAQYNRFKEAMKAYTNKLMIGITTAGDNVNSFGYRRQEDAVKVVSGLAEDDSLFVLIARADQDENGNVDYLNPIQHQKANLSYGVTIRPADMMNDARQAQRDPQQRKDFLSRSLNIYTNSMKAWFDMEEFKNSDAQYTWTIEELANLPIDWYGGADLSRMHDLTAAALYGQYEGVDIIITHAFFPRVQAVFKAEEDGIPVYEWADNGWLTMCNTPTINAQDVVNWFSEMRAKGFKIKQVGHDRKFAGEEYFPAMKQAHFSIVDQPQLYFLKNQGFRHIEKAAKDGKLYYMHSTAYEYCVSNVRGTERVDDAVQYEKIGEKDRIDLFDASVFACIRMLKNQEKRKKARDWFGD